MPYRPTTHALGQAAYKAYAAAVDNTSVNGDDLPDWDALTTPVRTGWQLAAEAVRHSVEEALTHMALTAPR